MILKGKYNQAIIYTDNVDSETISQIINLCNQEFLKDSTIRIMPDCHCGKGCTVGTTMTIKDKIIPNLVGVDIGCGVSGIKIENNIDLKKLDSIIRNNIPYGFNVHTRSREKTLKNLFNIDLRSLKCKVDLNRAFLSAGSLGGGNHFLEIDSDSKNETYLIVHTGSRNLGKNIAEYYQKRAIKYCKDEYNYLYKEKEAQIVAEFKKLEKVEEIPKMLKKIVPKVPENDLCFLAGDLMNDYLHDMNIAQKYAYANRILILSDILYKYYDLKKDFPSLCEKVQNNVIECIHNYINMEDMILRKGAISAKKDELVIIPINMKDGVIIGRGKGNKDWNESAPHGAGRIYSRSKAKEIISLDEFKDSMKDVFSTCVGFSTLDEAPQAYKPMDVILEHIHETIDIISILKPIYNFKSN